MALRRQLVYLHREKAASAVHHLGSLFPIIKQIRFRLIIGKKEFEPFPANLPASKERTRRILDAEHAYTTRRPML
jgi:hypothetical protein